jgi:hypothetical protein
MREITMVVVAGLIVALTGSASYALRHAGGPKYADPKLDGNSPTKNMPGIVKLDYTVSAKKGVRSGKVFFRISFDKKVKHFDAFWSKKGDDVSENRSGIKVKNLGVVNGLHEYSVTLNTGSIDRKIDSIDFFIGCYNPIMGYPNLRDISIVLDRKKGGKPIVSFNDN